MATDTVFYKICCDVEEKLVRMEVSGFETSEEAMAFADWLSEQPVIQDQELVIHQNQRVLPVRTFAGNSHLVSFLATENSRTGFYSNE